MPKKKASSNLSKSQKRVSKLPLGRGTLSQTASKIKERKAKQAEIMRQLNK